jgi:hypothetical protein
MAFLSLISPRNRYEQQFRFQFCSFSILIVSGVIRMQLRTGARGFFELCCHEARTKNARERTMKLIHVRILPEAAQAGKLRRNDNCSL